MATLKKWPELTIFWGWQVRDLVILGGDLFRIFFYTFLDIGKLGGSKKDQSPCANNLGGSPISRSHSKPTMVIILKVVKLIIYIA